VAAVSAAGHSQEMVDLDCQQYYTSNDRCQQMKAYFCDHASWRINFFTVWMNDYMQYRSQQGLPSFDTPTQCIQDECVCKHEEMKVCRQTPTGCDVCYCSDHQYQEMEKLVGVWQHDYQKWSQIQQEWRQIMISSSNNNNGNEDC